MTPLIEAAEQAPKMNGNNCSTSISFSPFLPKGEVWEAFAVRTDEFCVGFF